MIQSEVSFNRFIQILMPFAERMVSTVVRILLRVMLVLSWSSERNERRVFSVKSLSRIPPSAGRICFCKRDSYFTFEALESSDFVSFRHSSTAVGSGRQEAARTDSFDPAFWFQNASYVRS